MYQDKYNCICQNTKIRFIIHYVKSTAQQFFVFFFKFDFQKVDQQASRQVVNPRHQTPQGQSVSIGSEKAWCRTGN